MVQCILVNCRIDAKQVRIKCLDQAFITHQKKIFLQTVDMQLRKCIIVQQESLADFQEEDKLLIEKIHRDLEIIDSQVNLAIIFQKNRKNKKRINKISKIMIKKW